MQKAIGILLVLVFFIGCGTTVPLRQMVLRGSIGATDDKVNECLIKGGARKGWDIFEDGGAYVGTLNVRSHMIKVRFTVEGTKIIADYVDSANMAYDGSTIHRKYHLWVENRLFPEIRKCLVD